MNKFYLSLIGMMAHAMVQAQCFPNPIFAFLGIPGVYPLPTDPLPDGTVGTSYENNGYTISFICSNQEIDPSVLPLPLPFPIPSGNTVKITGMKISNVSGLPPGLNYACNHNCTFDVSNQGCVIISGTPTTPGDYSVSFSTSFTGEISGQFGTFPFTDAPPLPIAYNLKINDNLSIEEIQAKSLHLFPNPANEMVYMTWNETQSATHAEIIDLNGKLVTSHSFSAGENVAIETKNIPTGIYRIMMKSESGNRMKSAKLLVIH